MLVSQQYFVFEVSEQTDLNLNDGEHLEFLSVLSLKSDPTSTTVKFGKKKKGKKGGGDSEDSEEEDSEEEL